MVIVKKLGDKYKNMPVQMKASFWFLICSFFQKGISTVTTPVFTRLLTTNEYGQYNVFNSWLGIVAIFVTLNLSYGVYTQGLIKFEEKREIFSSSLQGLTVLLAGIWTSIYLLNRSFWNTLFSLTTVQMLAMLVMIWTTAVFNFWASEQRVLYKYKTLVAVTSAVSLAKPVIGIVFVIYAEDKVTARILGLVLAELIGYTGFFFVQMHKGKRFFDRNFWKYAVGFNLPLVPHYLSQTVLSSADRIMIERLTGAADAGVYSLAYSISQLMTLFNTAVMQTMNPWIYQKIKVKRETEIEGIAYVTLLLIAALNLLLIAFAPEIVTIFAPEAYYEAIYVIPPVAMSVYFMYMYDLFAKFAFYYEKTRFIMWASVVGAVLNVILNYVFIGIFGYRAAGYTTLLCYVIYSVCHYIFMNRVCDCLCEKVRPYDGKKLIAITLPFIAAGFLLLCTYDYPQIRYGVIAVVCIGMIIWRKKLVNKGKEILEKVVNK